MINRCEADDERALEKETEQSSRESVQVKQNSELEEGLATTFLQRRFGDG